MNRRSFLSALTAGVAALCGLKPHAAVTPMLQGLSFHPDAFALVSAPMPMRYDVLYGFAKLNPAFAVRVMDEPLDLNDPIYRLHPLEGPRLDPSRWPA